MLNGCLKSWQMISYCTKYHRYKTFLRPGHGLITVWSLLLHSMLVPPTPWFSHCPAMPARTCTRGIPTTGSNCPAGQNGAEWQWQRGGTGQLHLVHGLVNGHRASAHSKPASHCCWATHPLPVRIQMVPVTTTTIGCSWPARVIVSQCTGWVVLILALVLLLDWPDVEMVFIGLGNTCIKTPFSPRQESVDNLYMHCNLMAEAYMVGNIKNFLLRVVPKERQFGHVMCYQPHQLD